MKKIIEQQIKNQTRNSVGQADIKDVKSFIFRKDVTQINIDPIVWTKKYYKFDRGSKFPISDSSFKNYSNIIKYLLPSNPNGALIDGGLEALINAQYSVTIMCAEDTNIVLPINVAPNTNIFIRTFYYEDNGDGTRSIVNSEIISPSENYFSGATISFNFTGGKWTTIEVIVYRQSEAGFIIGFDDLIKSISAWRMSDFDAPSKPIWYKIPVTTLSNPDSGITSNTLKWVIPDEQDWAGHQIFRKVPISRGTTVTENTILNQPFTVKSNGTMDGYGNSGFILNTVDPDGFNSGSKLKVRGREYTVTGYQTIKGNLINNGDFSQKTPLKFKDWRLVCSASGAAIVRFGSTSISYTEHVVSGQSVLASARATSTTKSVYWESTTYIPIDRYTNYSLSFYTKPKNGASTIGKFGIAYYTNNTGTLCSTSTYSVSYTSTANWGKNSINYYSHTSSYRSINNTLPFIPSTCNYAKLRLYVTAHTNVTASRYFDAVKFSKLDNTGIYVNNTADSTLVKTKEKLSIPSNVNVVQYSPLNRDTAIIGVNDTDIGAVRKRFHPNLTSMLGGKEFTSTVTNHLINGSFTTTGNWTPSGCIFSVSTNKAYSPIFNTSCAVIEATKTLSVSTPYITQSRTAGSNASGAYCFSVYAKMLDNCTSLFMGVNASGTLKTKTFPITKNWQRFYLIDSANSFSASKSVRLGIPKGRFGKILVSGAQLEYRTAKTNLHPLPYNDVYQDGVTRKPLSYTALTVFDLGTALATAQGTVRCYYNPDYTSTTAPTRSTIFTSVINNVADNYLTCYYDGIKRKFIFESNKDGAVSTVTSTVQSFTRGQQIPIHCRWYGNTMDIAVNGTVQYTKTKIISNGMALTYLGLFNNVVAAQNYSANGIISDFMITNNKFSSRDLQIDSQATGISPSISNTNTDTSDREVEGYKIELIFDRKKSSEDVLNLVDGIDKSSPISWTHTPVTPNEDYTYLLKAYDNNFNISDFSDEQTIKAGDKIPPSPITSTSATRGYGNITWNWTNPVDTDFDRVRIYKTNNYINSNVIDTIYGEPGLKNSWSQNTSDGVKNIYITTLDYNNNENLNAVKITSSAKPVSAIIENTLINVNWQTDPPPSPGTYFKSDAAKLFDVIVVSDVQFTFPSAQYGLGIYGSNAVKIYGTAAPNTLNIGNTWQYRFFNIGLSYSDSEEGYGSIKFRASFAGQDVRQQISISLDRTLPPTPVIVINNVSGTSPNYSGDKQMISAKFTNLSADKYQCQLSTIAGYGESWYTDFDSCPLILPNYAKNYTIRGYVRDRALNVSAASGAVNYNFKGIGIKVNITPLSQPNQDDWYNTRPIFTLSGETTAPNTLKRLSYSIRRVNPGGANINASQTFTPAVTISRNVSFGGATADGVFELTCTAVDSYDRIAASAPLTIKQDDVKPSVNANVWVSSVTTFHNKSAYLKWYTGSITDANSGIKQYHILRSLSGIVDPWKRIGTVPYNVDNFSDSEDVLEGYVSYNYLIQAEDYASNTANSVVKTINIAADWDSTYRNWLDNGSFEIQTNQHWENLTATNTFKLFGQYSALLQPGGGGSLIRQSVMLPEMSSTFIKTTTRWVISYYALLSALIPSITIAYYDYAGNLLAADQYLEGVQTAGTSLADTAGNAWVRRYIVLDANSILGDTAVRGKATMITVQINAKVGGNNYIDGIQWEERLSSDTTPTKFRDNRVTTVERLHAGFIRANMIKVGDLHCGLFHANGVEIQDGITGAPYLQIGAYDSNESFMRFSNNGGYRHFPGDAIGKGYNLLDHVESGESRSGTVTFRKGYTDWNNNQVIPKVLVEPYHTPTYNPAWSADFNFIDIRKDVTPTGFSVTFYLAHISPVSATDSGIYLYNPSNATSPLTAGVNYDITFLAAYNVAPQEITSPVLFSFTVNWSANASLTAPEIIQVIFSTRDSVGVYTERGRRTISSVQDETVNYEYLFGNQTTARIYGTRLSYTVISGSGMQITGGYFATVNRAVNPIGYNSLTMDITPYKWMAFHNLY